MNLSRGVIGVSCAPFSRYRLLQSRLEDTVQQTIKLKEEKISSLEKKLEDSSRLIAALQGKLSTVGGTPKSCRFSNEEQSFTQVFVFSLGQQQGEGPLQRSGEDRDSTTELLRIKDHLITVEKKVGNPRNIPRDSSLDRNHQDFKTYSTSLRNVDFDMTRVKGSLWSHTPS